VVPNGKSFIRDKHPGKVVGFTQNAFELDIILEEFKKLCEDKTAASSTTTDALMLMLPLLLSTIRTTKTTTIMTTITLTLTITTTTIIMITTKHQI